MSAASWVYKPYDLEPWHCHVTAQNFYATKKMHVQIHCKFADTTCSILGSQTSVLKASVSGNHRFTTIVFLRNVMTEMHTDGHNVQLSSKPSYGVNVRLAAHGPTWVDPKPQTEIGKIVQRKIPSFCRFSPQACDGSRAGTTLPGCNRY